METNTPGNAPEATGRSGEYRRIVDIMQNAVNENLTLPEIAVRAAVSLTNLKLLFNEFSGQSPKRYYADLRVREARKLLKQATSITDVSQIMNFSSPNYFSTFYKRFAGATPSECKRPQKII